MKRVVLILLLGASVACWTEAGTKEDIIRLQSDVLTLQNQLRQLQKSVDENGAIAKTLIGQIMEILTKAGRTIDEVKAAQLEQTKTGNDNIEEILSEIRALSSKVDDMGTRLANLSKKVENIQSTIDAMKNQRSASDATTDGKRVPLSPDQLYNLAYNDYIQGNYDLAIQGFLDFMANYKDSELAEKAQYYIGDCYFNQSKFTDAISAFNQVTALFPKGDKAPAAFLKSGLAYLNMKDNNSAITQFKNVIVKYPDSPEANIAVQQLQILGVEPPAKPKKR